LIKQGATMVTEAADVVATLQPILGRPIVARSGGDRLEEAPAGTAPRAEATPPTDTRARMLTLLGPTPISLDDLTRLSGQALSTVHTLLLELELAGRLIRHRGGMVSLAAADDQA
ncbi:MAG TPA: hypothetical protein VK281_08115, partial [Xanthobacteraceae bacterium]|nr:hypothetical protein [Xanthobacteraceae bacterium]